MAGRGGLSVRVTGFDELIKRAKDERMLRRPLRKAFRTAAKAVKANVITIARPISRSLTRRVRVEVDGAWVPEWARVVNKSPWIHVAERGRRPGAKMPPVTALRGGFAAAKAVSERGLPGHGVMARAAAASRGDVTKAIDIAAREMERQWRG